MAAKRKRDIAAAAAAAIDTASGAPMHGGSMPPPPRPKAPKRRSSARNAEKVLTNPQENGEIIDAPDALRASPDSDVNEDIAPGAVKRDDGSESPLSDVPEVEVEPPKKKRVAGKAAAKKGATAAKENGDATAATPKTPPAAKAQTKGEHGDMGDPEAEGDEEANEEELQEALSRPPPVNSDYLPLPWKGRIGYACLNTYLRYSTPPVFSSRTCRIASILEHRHPLKDPSQPEHPTKNRPDREQPADVTLGQKYVEEIGLANARDIIKMIRWNDRYNIMFFRLSSEMFPFASHPEYGYKLAPFAAEALAEAGKVIAELGHRVTTHPGQFTQLGSPRKQVIDNAFRDLEYHDELLSLLKLPEQQDKDAVMILHMGGIFGDKAATLDRFRENYAKLSQSIKNRLVLENDDVCYSVHDLLPICEELNIPLVLDFHHHNIVFDSTQIREGTKDIMELFPRIKATWTRKGITQKMHYSEPTPAAITGRQRRKHNPRVWSLPPCANDMDLMIEAKDKEQAVFELMKTFKLPGFDTFNDVIPHVRNDDNKAAMQAAGKKKKATPKKGKKAKQEEEDEDEVASAAAAAVEAGPTTIPDEEVGMGGPEGRVYWPIGMEDWLRPKKREIKKKEPGEEKKLTPAQKKKAAAAAEAAAQAASLEAVVKEEDGPESDEDATPATKKAKQALKNRAAAAKAKASALLEDGVADDGAATATATATAKPKKNNNNKKKAKKEAKEVPTPSTSDAEEDEEDLNDPVLESDAEEPDTPLPKKRAAGSRKSNRASKAKVNYTEGDVSMDDA